MNPERVELEPQDRCLNGTLLDNLEALRSQKTKLEHAVERLIDSFAEGLIEKDQFATRMARTKSRIADLDNRIRAYAGDVDQREHLRLAMKRLRQLAATIGPELGSADLGGHRKEVPMTRLASTRAGRSPEAQLFSGHDSWLHPSVPQFTEYLGALRNHWEPQSYGASARCGLRDPGFARSNSYQHRAVYGAVFDEVANGLY